MDLIKVMDRLYYDTVLSELQMMHGRTCHENITYNSHLYLDLIVYNKNCTVTYLANILHISKSAVTIKVNELVKQGVVEKIQDEKDKRVYYIRATDQVAKEFEVFDKKAKYAAQKIQEKFSEEAIDQLCAMLTEYSRYYQQEGEL